MDEVVEPRWLVLIHRLPPKPDYLRVKVGRRLQRLGAVAIKNSVYVLPRNPEALEDFQWLVREIAQEGGEASICEARFVVGLSDERIHDLFHQARKADYTQLSEEARRVGKALPASGEADENLRGQMEIDLARLKRRFAEVGAIDFFGAQGRETAAGLIAGLEARLRPTAASEPLAQPSRGIDGYRGRTWVTRKGIHVDRMASAWLIRRFVDTDAQFKFVAGKDYRPDRGELRFDMFDGEFTHEGDRCTFEVLVGKFRLDDHDLGHIAQIVHDIDLKDSKFGRVEAPGIDRLVAGIAMAHRDDEERLSRGSAVFEDLYEYFRRKNGD